MILAELNQKLMCGKCGNQITDVEDIRIINSGDNKTVILVCTNCFNTVFVECECCHESDVVHTMIRTDINTFACDLCVKAFYYQCADSGDFVHYSRAIKIGKNWYCPNSAKHYGECAACHKVHKIEHLNEYGSACEICLRKVVQNYNTRAETIFPFFAIPKFKSNGEPSFDNRISRVRKGENVRYYGVELEVQHCKDNKEGLTMYQAAKQVQNYCRDFAFLKYDRSLQEDEGAPRGLWNGQLGYEIVTAPATYECHEKWWPRFFAKYKERDLMISRFSKCCGMHVHVSKSSLTPLQIGKMFVFVYAQQNRKFISCIAQRGSNRFQDFTRAKKVTDALGGDWIDALGKEPRHTAINIMNKETVEIRIFKGTLRKDHFFKNMEFVKALIDFCESGVASMKDCKDYKKFCAFITENSSSYPNLYKFLVEKKYCFYKSSKPPIGIKRNIQIKSKNLICNRHADIVPCDIRAESTLPVSKSDASRAAWLQTIKNQYAPKLLRKPRRI